MQSTGRVEAVISDFPLRAPTKIQKTIKKTSRNVSCEFFIQFLITISFRSEFSKTWTAISPQCRPLKKLGLEAAGRLIYGVEETSFILLMVQKSGEKTSWGSRLVVKIPLFTRYWHHPRWFWSPDFWLPSTVSPENHGIPKAARSKTSVDRKYLDGWWHPVFLMEGSYTNTVREKKTQETKKTCNFAEFRSHQKLVLCFGHQL